MERNLSALPAKQCETNPVVAPPHNPKPLSTYNTSVEVSVDHLCTVQETVCLSVPPASELIVKVSSSSCVYLQAFTQDKVPLVLLDFSVLEKWEKLWANINSIYGALKQLTEIAVAKAAQRIVSASTLQCQVT